MEGQIGAVDESIIRLARDGDLGLAALMLALTLGQKGPGCLYVAIEGREGAAPVTAGAQMCEHARRRSISTYLVKSS